VATVREAPVSWLPVIALAVLAFLAAVVLLRLPRAGFTLLGAALLFGLAGYALQGSPGVPGSPGKPLADAGQTGELIVQARREFFDSPMPPSRFLITSDAYARRGDHLRAAGFAESAVKENPNDIEAWTALGNALAEHAGGQLTPAALYAYAQAERRAPGSPAPGYFLGLALLRGGQAERARAIWAELLASAPANAVWRPALAERVARLDSLLAQGIAQ
jgi:cytochrome c-type biogenesis protein CcmH